jgi:rhamnosyltransferase
LDRPRETTIVRGMPSPSVQIVLAAYQGEAWLPDMLRSVQAQTYRDWTMLVRDDGSSDSSRQILSDAAAADRRIAIFADDGQRRGPVANFSLLLQQAWNVGADFIFLADQDDIWHADKVARQVRRLQAADGSVGRKMPHLVFCDAAVVDSARRLVHASFLRQNRLPFGSGRPLKTLLGRSFILGCATAVNRSLLELALPLPEVVASHDWWLALCAASAGRITCLERPLLDYRRHAASTSAAAFWKVLGSNPLRWRRRWQIGWESFQRSIAQAKALRDRLRQRKVAAGPEGELLEAFCRIADQPGRWRRIRKLHELGVPAIDWPRRVLYDACMLLAPACGLHAAS